MDDRYSTGIPRLDTALGGGLLPGTLTMVIGATGVGKTQIALQFSQQSRQQEQVPGAIIDLSSRGDSQNHRDYSLRLFDQDLTVADQADVDGYNPFRNGRPRDVLPFLGYGGRRVLRSQMDADAWHAWQSELNRRMPALFRHVYGHLVHGTRRFIIDGVEPQEDAADSLQLDLLELIYHRMLRTDDEWLAREVFREKFLENQALVQKHAYDASHSSAVVLVTTRETMLEQLIARPLAAGDLAAGANTVLLLGRVLNGSQMRRGLYIAKHRGSYADSAILDFEIDDSGIQIKD